MAARNTVPWGNLTMLSKNPCEMLRSQFCWKTHTHTCTHLWFLGNWFIFHFYLFLQISLGCTWNFYNEGKNTNFWKVHWHKFEVATNRNCVCVSEVTTPLHLYVLPSKNGSRPQGDVIPQGSVGGTCASSSRLHPPFFLQQLTGRFASSLPIHQHADCWLQFPHGTWSSKQRYFVICSMHSLMTSIPGCCCLR